MNRKTATLVTLLMLVLPGLIQASPASEACVADYNEGRYSDAALCFEGLEAEGHLTGHLLYDQGNAWHRAGNLGKALLAYRRAEILMPRDGDLWANIDTARELTRDELPPAGGRGFVLGALLLPIDRMSASELLLLGALGWALLFGLATVQRVRPMAGLRAGMVLGASMALLGLGGWLFQTWEQANRPVGVILVDEVTLRSGRDLQSRDLVVLHEGSEVFVVERGSPWVQVAVPSGPRGWLPAKSLGLAELRPTSTQESASD